MSEKLQRDRPLRPLYLQIADQLRARLVQGEWDAGEAILSVRQIESEYHVASMTARAALAELVRLGLVEAIPGRGFYVKDAA
jgi:GntR family transcriptional regulator